MNVLLLEAGPEEPLATLVPAFAVKSVGTFLDWGFETEPQKGACEARGGRCRWPRGKMVAGTGGMQVRFAPSTTHTKSRVIIQIDTYFLWIEEFHGF